MIREGRGDTPPPGWPRPQALLLDAMGTLFGLRAPVGRTYSAIAAEHGLQLDPATLDRAFACEYRTAPPLAFAGLVGAELEQAERDWWSARIDAVLRAVGEERGAPPALHRQLFDTYADPRQWRVYDEVPEALARWRGQGLRLAVVSNFDQRLEGLLEAFNLLRWLDVVILSSRVGAAKPSPRPFQLALERLELEPRQAWHIGDSPEDEAGARAAGLPCVLVRRP
jgi:putative hydrolase of the HAD superfamily